MSAIESRERGAAFYASPPREAGIYFRVHDDVRGPDGEHLSAMGTREHGPFATSADAERALRNLKARVRRAWKRVEEAAAERERVRIREAERRERAKRAASWPACGCSACRQHWIDTGDTRCVKGEAMPRTAHDCLPGESL